MSDAMYKKCERCSANFYVSEMETWKKICLNCWKKTKDVQDKGYERIKEQESLIKVLYSRIAELELLGSKTIEPEMLKRLIMLCHPDRHDQSEASKKATQFLLDMKRSH